MANNVLQGKLVQLSIASRNHPGKFEVCGLHCGGHQAVLSMKPNMSQIPGLCTAMVRAGNIWQTNRFNDNWVKHLEAWADKCEFKQIWRRPADANLWQAHLEQILVLSRPALDIDPAGEAFIKMYMNCDPTKKKLIHFHLPGCPCGGSTKRQENWRRTLRLLFLSGCPQCQLHRWKNFERALCFFYRGRSIGGDLILRHLERQFDRKAVLAAERELAAAARAGEDNFAAKVNVRGGKLLHWCKHTDGEHKWLHLGINLNGPLQWYLNKIFQCEKFLRLGSVIAPIVLLLCLRSRNKLVAGLLHLRFPYHRFFQARCLEARVDIEVSLRFQYLPSLSSCSPP